MRFVSCVLIAAVTMLAGASHAIESLTGTYSTKYRCSGIFNGESQKISGKEDSAWYIDDLGDGNVYLHLAPGGSWKYHGWLEVDAQKPTQGILGFADCGIESGYPQGEARVLRVKTSPGKLKVVLKGTGVGFRNFGAQVCALTFTRTSTTIPVLDSTCP